MSSSSTNTCEAPLVEFIQTNDIDSTFDEIKKKEEVFYKIPEKMGKFKGYQGEDVFVIVNPSRNVIRLNERLICCLMDRYSFRVEMPYKSQMCKPRKVYIISQMSVKDFERCFKLPERFAWRMSEFGTLNKDLGRRK